MNSFAIWDRSLMPVWILKATLRGKCSQESDSARRFISSFWTLAKFYRQDRKSKWSQLNEENLLNVLYCSATNVFDFRIQLKKQNVFHTLLLSCLILNIPFCRKMTCGLNFVLSVWIEIVLLIFCTEKKAVHDTSKSNRSH